MNTLACRHGHHPEYDEVGQFQEGELKLGVQQSHKVDQDRNQKPLR